MMNKENTYFLTCQEVYEVLKRLPDRQLRLIPEEVIKNIEINAQKSEQEYNLKVDAMQRVILSRQARAMLMAIYSQYFLDEMTNKMLKQRLQETRK